MKNAVTNSTNALKLPLDINAWKLIGNDKVELIQIDLKTDEEVEPHINPVDVIFYVVDGSGVLSIEGKNQVLNSGDCIPVAAGLTRGWINDTNKVLKLLVVKH